MIALVLFAPAETVAAPGLPSEKLNHPSEAGVPSSVSITITGFITDAKNNPLQGVSVLVKGTKNGTSTSSQGQFTLNNVPENGRLVFSSTGFTTQELSVKDAGNPVTLRMVEEAINLNEVVVIGYGTASKKDLTGAVSSVKATQLENENPGSVQDVLRGNVPGLNISTATSAKGGGDLLVRGRTSINAGTSPLIVEDGGSKIWRFPGRFQGRRC